MAQDTNEEVMSGLYHLVDEIIPASEDQVLIASQLSKFRSGQGIFGRQRIAVKVLSQTASSCEAERNWKVCGFM